MKWATAVDASSSLPRREGPAPPRAVPRRSRTCRRSPVDHSIASPASARSSSQRPRLKSGPSRVVGLRSPSHRGRVDPRGAGSTRRLESALRAAHRPSDLGEDQERHHALSSETEALRYAQRVFQVLDPTEDPREAARHPSIAEGPRAQVLGLELRGQIERSIGPHDRLVEVATHGAFRGERRVGVGQLGSMRQVLEDRQRLGQPRSAAGRNP